MLQIQRHKRANMIKPAVVYCLTYVTSAMEQEEVHHTEQTLTLRDLSHQCVLLQLEPYFTNTETLPYFLIGIDIVWTWNKKNKKKQKLAKNRCK